MKFSIYACLIATLALTACAKNHDQVGGETNWLQTCDDDRVCDRGACFLGVCTIDCQRDAQCRGAFHGSCVRLPAIVSASEWKAEPPAVDALCMPTCGDDDACGPGFACRDSFCVTRPNTQAADASTVSDASARAGAFELCNDSVSCAQGECLCGVCTTACQQNSQCTAAFSGVCATVQYVMGRAGCDGDAPQADALCMPSCDDSHACAPGFGCSDSICIKLFGADPLNGP